MARNMTENLVLAGTAVGTGAALEALSPAVPQEPEAVPFTPALIGLGVGLGGMVLGATQQMGMGAAAVDGIVGGSLGWTGARLYHWLTRSLSSENGNGAGTQTVRPVALSPQPVVTRVVTPTGGTKTVVRQGDTTTVVKPCNGNSGTMSNVVNI